MAMDYLDISHWYCRHSYLPQTFTTAAWVSQRQKSERWRQDQELLRLLINYGGRSTVAFSFREKFCVLWICHKTLFTIQKDFFKFMILSLLFILVLPFLTENALYGGPIYLFSLLFYSGESLKGAGPEHTVPCRHAIAIPYTNLLTHYLPFLYAF